MSLTERQLAEELYKIMDFRKYKHFIQADKGTQEDMLRIAKKIKAEWVPKELALNVKKTKGL
jgi:hypothetical protein